MKTVAETVFQLLLSDRRDADIRTHFPALFGCKKFQRLTRVVQYQVFEVLVMCQSVLNIFNIRNSRAHSFPLSPICRHSFLTKRLVRMNSYTPVKLIIR